MTANDSRRTRKSGPNTARLDNGTFGPGNPGKPKGARHRVTQLAEQLMADDTEAVVRKIIEAAKAGDMQAARVVIDRILPARKSRTVSIALPKIDNAGDLLKAVSAVVEAVGAGELDPDEGAALAGLLEAKRRTLEVVDIEQRLSVLEARQKK